MSYNEGGYYCPETSGPSWEQPCYTGAPQHQGPQFSPQNQKPPYVNQTQGLTFPSQNEGTQFVPQNQGPEYSQNSFHQNQGNFGPTQHHIHPCSTQNSQCDQFQPQNPGHPQFSPHNHGPMCTPQIQGPHFPNQSNPLIQVPISPPQNREPHYPPQHQGPCYQSHNPRPRFPPEHQCTSRFPPHNSGPRFPLKTQGPHFPPQNQGLHCQNPCQSPFVPPQNHAPQFHPQNPASQGSSQNQCAHYPPFNQGAPFPTQNQGSVGPPQNHGSQLSPQIQPQNQIPCCCPPVNQSPQCSLNQGTSCQNQGPLGPIQSQNASCPPNPGPPIPSQSLPSLLPQNQSPICPPQNSRPMCPPQNYRPNCPPQNVPISRPLCPSQDRPPFHRNQHQSPRFPTRHQVPNNGRGFSPNNGPFYGPHNQGPRFPHPSEAGQLPDESYENQFEEEDWNNEEEEYTGDCSNQPEEYGVDWDDRNDDCEDWNNQEVYCEEDWNIQRHNHKWKNSFKHSVPSKRGRRKGFFERDFEEPPVKRQQVSPKTSTYEGTANIKTSINQVCNNIQINFVKLSDMDNDSNLQDSSLNESEPRHTLTKKGTLQSLEKCEAQKNITKASQNTTIIKTNNELYNKTDGDAHKKADVKKVISEFQEKKQEPKPVDKLVQSISTSTDISIKHKNTIEGSSSTIITLNKDKITDNESNEKQFKVIHNTSSNTSLSKLTQKTSNKNLLEDKMELCTKSNQRKTNDNPSDKTVQNEEKSTQNSNKYQDKQVAHNTHTDNPLSKSTEKLSDENLVPEDTAVHYNSNQHEFDISLNPKRMKTQEKTTQYINNHQDKQVIVNTPANSSHSKSTQKLFSENLALEDKTYHCSSKQDEFNIRSNLKIVQNKEKTTQNIINHQEEQVIINTPTNSLLSKSTQKLSSENLVLEDKTDQCSPKQDEFNIKSNLKIVKNKEKSFENLNYHEEKQVIGNTPTYSALTKSTHNLSTENPVLAKTYLCNKSHQSKHNFKLSPKTQKNQHEAAFKNFRESDNKQSQFFKNTPVKNEGYDNVNAQNITDSVLQNHPHDNVNTSNITRSLLKNKEVSCSELKNYQANLKEVKNTQDCTIFKNQGEPAKSIKLSTETSNLKREEPEPRHSLRLNPQSVVGSACTTNNKSCDVPGNPKETPSILLTVDSIKSESEVQNKIKYAKIKSEIIINNTADIPSESIKTLDQSKDLIENDETIILVASMNIKTEKENTTDVSSSKTTVATNHLARQEKPEPDGTSNIASNEMSHGNTTNIQNEVALENNEAAPEDNTATLEKRTNSLENTIIVSDRPSSKNIQLNDESQNHDVQMNYQPANEDSQTSSCLSRDDVNLREANLREFDILDEVEGSDNDADQSTIPSEESDSDVSDQEALEIGEEDIDAMLEEGLDVNKETTDNKVPKKIRHKVILEEIGHNHFDLLPEGWIQVMHNSGMPVYLHQKARVCSMTRPYFLGPGSVRSHKIPLSSIPCLQYKRALEIEKKYEEENSAKRANVSENSSENRPPLLPVVSAKIETAEENEAAQSLESTELQEYCKKVFNFKTISIIPFKTWGNRRKYGRITKDLKKQDRPLLPRGTKLLKFPIQNPDGSVAKSKGEWVINPNGKSYVCILHEYVQQALKQHPKYQFKELKNPSTPYSATVFIGEMQYGTGIGASKKYAKLEAAKAALEVLIPEMKDKLENENEFGIKSGIPRKPQDYENSIFDQIRIEDPRVAEFCAKTTEPPPYAILATCLQRNGMGLNEVKVEYNMNTKRNKEDQYKMTVKNHTATVMCKNKREGKQKAAQAILKALHPNIEHFGSLLRMYGNHSIKSVKEKKREEQEITGLQCKAAVNQPNFAILNKLNSEMIKLASRKKEQLSKGKFVYHNNLLLPSASTADLKKINL